MKVKIDGSKIQNSQLFGHWTKIYSQTPLCIYDHRFLLESYLYKKTVKIYTFLIIWTQPQTSFEMIVFSKSLS